MPVIKYRCVFAATLAIFTIGISSASVATADTIYSGSFDYKRATPSSTYFAGKSDAQITSFCKDQRHTSQADIDACAHRGFEQEALILSTKVSNLYAGYRAGDEELKKNGWPIAAPYFEKAQTDWTIYRDNSCYAETYGLGEASLRYTEFWDCMTRITKTRVNELSAKDAE